MHAYACDNAYVGFVTTRACPRESEKVTLTHVHVYVQYVHLLIVLKLEHYIRRCGNEHHDCKRKRVGQWNNSLGTGSSPSKSDTVSHARVVEP